ncbi:MAG: flagellin, partial [Oscillibacter sp.]|nr:flagellin [Oscillibacter sp.]
MTAADLKAALTKAGYNVADTTNDDGTTTLTITANADGSSGAASIKTSSGLTLQIGDTSESYNQLGVVIGDMHVRSMGTMGAGDKVVAGKSIDDIDISNPEGASAAINVIRDAINYVSGVRGDLGATQNRLEHTANNLSVMAENIQDAESTIRDTDVAE